LQKKVGPADQYPQIIQDRLRIDLDKLLELEHGLDWKTLAS